MSDAGAKSKPIDWHTPGPWQGSMNSHMVPEVKAGPITIATLWLPPMGSAFANQRLIVSAPDLLETIRDYREAILYTQDKASLMTSLRSADDRARALIAYIHGAKS